VTTRSDGADPPPKHPFFGAESYPWHRADAAALHAALARAIRDSDEIESAFQLAGGEDLDLNGSPKEIWRDALEKLARASLLEAFCRGLLNDSGLRALHGVAQAVVDAAPETGPQRSRPKDRGTRGAADTERSAKEATDAETEDDAEPSPRRRLGERPSETTAARYALWGTLAAAVIAAGGSIAAALIGGAGGSSTGGNGSTGSGSTGGVTTGGTGAAAAKRVKLLWIPADCLNKTDAGVGIGNCDNARTVDWLATEMANLALKGVDGFDKLPKFVQLASRDSNVGRKNFVLTVRDKDARVLNVGVGYDAATNTKDGCLRLFFEAKLASEVVCYLDDSSWCRLTNDGCAPIR